MDTPTKEKDTEMNKGKEINVIISICLMISPNMLVYINFLINQLTMLIVFLDAGNRSPGGLHAVLGFQTGQMDSIGRSQETGMENPMNKGKGKEDHCDRVRIRVTLLIV